MTLKRLCCHLWTENENKITELQLSMLVRMLKTPNFSTRMNALQVSRRGFFGSIFFIYQCYERL